MISNSDIDRLRGLFAKRLIATMDMLKKTVGTVADLTVFRKLRELDYCTSYSHRGRFYTLRELAEFDENGLWWIRSVGFSSRGTLVATAEGLVNASEAGYAVEELHRRWWRPRSSTRNRRARDRACRRRLSGPSGEEASKRTRETRDAPVEERAASGDSSPGQDHKTRDTLHRSARPSDARRARPRRRAAPVRGRFRWSGSRWPAPSESECRRDTGVS